MRADESCCVPVPVSLVGVLEPEQPVIAMSSTTNTARGLTIMSWILSAGGAPLASGCCGRRG